MIAQSLLIMVVLIGGAFLYVGLELAAVYAVLELLGRRDRGRDAGR